MFRKFLARFAVTVAVLASTLFVASGPAQAWVYCNPTETANAVNMYDRQGYCGTKWLVELPYLWGCRTLVGTSTNNNVSSASNRTPYGATFYGSTDCTGSGYYLRAGTSHPNFCVLAVGCETVSSVKLT